MHTNSLIAYYDERKKFNKREKLVYGQLAFGGTQTDREIKDAIFSANVDMNAVRPRISDLIAKGWIIECGKVKDKVTHKLVRILKAVSPEERVSGQLDLAI